VVALFSRAVRNERREGESVNWPKLVVEYGQAAALGAILLSVLGLIAVFRRSRRFLPRGWVSWVGSIVAIFVIYQSVGFLRWAQGKVNPLKPVFREANQTAPDFTFKLLAGDSARRLADYRGKVVVLNIWATWCPPCRQEMPELDRLQQQYAKDGLVVIAVTDEPSSQIAKFTGLGKMQVVKGRVEPSSATTGLYVEGKVARPVTHIIDRDGVLRETLIGGQDYASFESRVKPYLQTGHQPP